MSDLELRISRYLDGEMSPEEEADLRLQLEVSPEARALLREMTLLKRAARRIPSLDQPRRSVEAKLFGQLRAEGLYAGQEESPVSAAEPYADRARASRRRMPVRGVVTTLALLFLAIVMGDQLRTPERPGTDAPVAAVTGERPVSAPLASLAAPGPMAPGTGSDADAVDARQEASRSRRMRPVSARLAMPAGQIASLDGAGRGAGAAGRVLGDQSGEERNMSVMAFKASPLDGGTGDAVGQMDQADQASAAAPPAAPLPAEALALRNALRSGRNDALASSSLGREQAGSEPVVRIHSASRDEGSLFAASVRPGVSYIDKGGGMMAQEMSFRFDASLGEHHQVSLIAGRAPTVSETRTERTRLPDEPKSLASTNRTDTRMSNGGFQESGATPVTSLDQLSAPELSLPVLTNSSSLAMKNEVWFGVGYTYSFAPVKAIRVGAGAKAGGSPTSWRVGLEMPVRYRVTSNVAVEAVPSATYVSPYDRSASAYAADESVDGYSYKGESQRLSFTSIGLEIGLRIEFGH